MMSSPLNTLKTMKYAIKLITTNTPTDKNGRKEEWEN